MTNGVTVPMKPDPGREAGVCADAYREAVLSAEEVLGGHRSKHFVLGFVALG